MDATKVPASEAVTLVLKKAWMLDAKTSMTGQRVAASDCRTSIGSVVVTGPV